MLLQEPRPTVRGFLWGLATLLLGIAIGFIARPLAWRIPAVLGARPTSGAVPPRATDGAPGRRNTRREAPGSTSTPAGPSTGGTRAPAGLPPPPGASLQTGSTTAGGETVPPQLPTLRLDFDARAAAVLDRVRERALTAGVLEQSPQDEVAATVTVEGHQLPARIRIKGDLPDHVDTDKFSLRITMEEGSFLGMRRFSIQHPKTRGWLREWLILEAARREGVLAPRATFVEVTRNGQPKGIYFLEEHFAKELLESQGRREGPIVKFDESAFWSAMNQYGPLRIPAAAVESLGPGVAERDVFGAGRILRDETLARELDDAFEELGEIQRCLLEERTVDPPPRLDPDPLHEAWERVVDRIIDVDRVATMHAVQSLFTSHHGLSWHNLRWAFDPVTRKLEPILFDAMPLTPMYGSDPIGLAAALYDQGPMVRLYSASRRYLRRVTEELARLVGPGWLQGLFDAVGEELEGYEQALRAEGILPPGESAADLRNALREACIHIRGVLRQPHPVHADVRLVATSGEGEPLAGDVTADLWCTTRIPVVVEGFRLQNGHVVTAREALEGAPSSVLVPRDGSVTLFGPGRHVPFRFPVDTRLLNLESIGDLVAALREGAEPGRGVAFPMHLRFHTLGEEATRERLLVARWKRAAWEEEGTRPPAPSVKEALDRHPFLAWDVDRGVLVLRPGTWTVEGDLVLPRRVALHADTKQGSVELRFEPGAALVAEASLVLQGTAASPIVLTSTGGGEAFGGIVVLDAPHPSLWEHVVVRRAGSLRRGGWMTTGGVTFHRCAAVLRDCRFEEARGEDACNVLGGEITLERVTFQGCASDAFDGDFVQGTILDSVFARGGGDGVDLSGSQVVLRGCRFTDLADKAVSAGEQSEVEVEGCTVERCALGVVAKDLSRVRVQGLTAREILHWVLAAYQKKEVYGPATIRVEGLDAERDASALALVQIGSEVAVEGKLLPVRDFDVAALYRDGTLGN